MNLRKKEENEFDKKKDFDYQFHGGHSSWVGLNLGGSFEGKFEMGDWKNSGHFPDLTSPPNAFVICQNRQIIAFFES